MALRSASSFWARAAERAWLMPLMAAALADRLTAKSPSSLPPILPLRSVVRPETGPTYVPWIRIDLLLQETTSTDLGRTLGPAADQSRGRSGAPRSAGAARWRGRWRRLHRRPRRPRR